MNDLNKILRGLLRHKLWEHGWSALSSSEAITGTNHSEPFSFSIQYYLWGGGEDWWECSHTTASESLRWSGLHGALSVRFQAWLWSEKATVTLLDILIQSFIWIGHFPYGLREWGCPWWVFRNFSFSFSAKWSSTGNCVHD